MNTCQVIRRQNGGKNEARLRFITSPWSSFRYEKLGDFVLGQAEKAFRGLFLVLNYPLSTAERQRLSAAMERSGIAVRCSALFAGLFCTFVNSYCLTLHSIPFQKKVSDVVDPAILAKHCLI